MLQNVRSNGQGLKARGPLAGFLVGGLMGAGFALLKAPQSGAETRRKLRAQAIELQDRTAQALADAQSRVREVTDRATERATGLQASGTAALKEAQKHVHRAVEETKMAAEAATTISSGEIDASPDQSGIA